MGQAPDYFQTARLSTERLRDKHFELLYELNQDRRVAATLGGTRTAAQTQQFLTRAQLHWLRHGYGIWLLTQRADGRFVGRAGLRRGVVGGNEEVELLYAFLPAVWGQGLATEIAQALVEIAFTQIGLTSLICFTLESNLASQQVMRKAGFIYERMIIHADLPHVFARLTLQQWRARD